MARQGQPPTRGDHLSQISGLLADIAELQLAGWHGAAAQRLSQHLDCAVEIRLPLPDVVSILAACRLWSGAALEALALLSGAPGCGAGGDAAGSAGRRPRRADEAHRGGGQERSLSTLVIEALALAELTQHRLVGAGTAREAVMRAAERCTAPMIRSSATPLRAMGLRPQRVQPMLRGIEFALRAMETGASPDQALARCATGSVEGPEPVLVAVAHELLAIGRWACAEASSQPQPDPVAAAAESRSRSARGHRGSTATSRADLSAWTLHERIGAVMPSLRAIVDRLADWPLRRRWLRLEHARRQVAHARDQPLPPWVARSADLEMIAGIIARYPDDTDAACDLLDEARLMARERCPRLARSQVGRRSGGVVGMRGDQRVVVGAAERG